MPTKELRLEVQHLLRNDDVLRAGAFATRRLIHVVAEWSPSTVLDITLSAEGGMRHLTLATSGSRQPGWEADVAWALTSVATVRPSASPGAEETPVDLTQVFEVVRERVAAPVRQVNADWFSPAEEYEDQVRDVSAAVGWPKPIGDDLSDISALMHDHPGLVLKIRLSAASAMEAAILSSEVKASRSRLDPDLDDYIGRIVRARLLVGTTSAQIPARFLAQARRLGTGLVVRRLDSTEARAAWEGSADSLIGHAVPEGEAKALVRLPVASEVGGFPGFSTRSRTVQVRALDPMPPTPEIGIRLGRATSATGESVDVVVSPADLCQHGTVVGASGTYKSTFIAGLIRSAIEQGVGVTFLDPHSETVNLVLQELPEGTESKVRVVRYGDPARPTPLNVFPSGAEGAERTIQDLNDFLREYHDPNDKGWLGPRFFRWFTLIARGTHALLGERTSLTAIEAIGSDNSRVKRLAQAIQAEHADLAKSLLDEIVNDRSSDQASLLAWCTSKLNPLVATSDARAVLGTGRNGVDYAAAMDEGKALLIDLASPVVGESTARFMAALNLMSIRSALGRRKNKTPHILICDEAHLHRAGALPRMLQEARKFGLGVWVVTQSPAQLAGPLVDALQSNSATFISGRTSVQNAPASAHRLGGYSERELIRLPNLTAAASISRDGILTDPFTLEIDHHERMEKTGARGPEAAERGRRIEEISRRELVDPYLGSQLFDAAAVDQILREVLERKVGEVGREMKLKRAVESSAHDSGGADNAGAKLRATPPESSFLDEWLEERRTAALSQKASDQ